MTTSTVMRRRFFVACWKELRVIWPVFSGLVGTQLVLGVLAGLFENWSVGDAVYFSFVTGLTIGYGDLVPLRLLTRLIAIFIGFIGILTTGLVAAVGVRALQEATTAQGAAQPPYRDERRP